MKAFMDADFLLQTETAGRLFHETAKELPVIDFHNHLSPKEIAEDMRYENIAQVWLSGDHYKWRAMRAHGVAEKLITGDGAPYEKFEAWADTVENAIGNPLYHWTHLELQRYFGVRTVLKKGSAKEIWEICNAKLQEPAFSARGLLRQQKVEALCTTDDPADDLRYHRALKEEGFEVLTLPSFRPEKALGIEKEDFAEYLEKLSGVSGVKIESSADLLSALCKRLAFFKETGARVSDHSIEGRFFEKTTEAEVDAILKKRLSGEAVTEEECAKFRGYMLTELGKEYARQGFVMQLHIGALRNNSGRFFRKLGPDTGFDSMNDFPYAAQLSALLNAMDEEDLLPRTILYGLNGRDYDMLSSMAGNFQGNEEGIRGKVQTGSAWWFMDQKSGMEKQMKSLMSIGMLSTFIGMLTDSRSFLSFPRHEYFRRILCNLVGRLVEDGEVPDDEDSLERLIRGICHDNAKAYFSL